MSVYSTLVGEIKQTPQDYDDTEYSELIKELKQISAQIDEISARKLEGYDKSSV